MDTQCFSASSGMGLSIMMYCWHSTARVMDLQSNATQLQSIPGADLSQHITPASQHAGNKLCTMNLSQVAHAQNCDACNCIKCQECLPRSQVQAGSQGRKQCSIMEQSPGCECPEEELQDGHVVLSSGKQLLQVQALAV